MANPNIDQEGVALGVDGGAGALKFAIQPSGDAAAKFYECAGATPTLIGMNEFISRLSQGIQDALGSAQCNAEHVTTAGFGLSGVDRKDEIEHLKAKIRLVLPNLKGIWVGNDALPALRQGAGSLRGLVLIAGTGSICYGVAANGHQIRVGGWGGELGDEGSGYWIGVRGLQAACRMADGRLSRTELLRKVLAKLNVKTAEELIPWASSKTRGEFKTAASSLFPIVSEQAAEGDPTAKQALLLGIGHLIQHVLAAAGRVERYERKEMIEADTETQDLEVTQVEGDDDIRTRRRFTLVCAGGLFTGDKDFYETFIFQLKRKKDIFDPTRLLEPASLGALALGREAVTSVVAAT